MIMTPPRAEPDPNPNRKWPPPPTVWRLGTIVLFFFFFFYGDPSAFCARKAVGKDQSISMLSSLRTVAREESMESLSHSHRHKARLRSTSPHSPRVPSVAVFGLSEEQGLGGRGRVLQNTTHQRSSFLCMGGLGRHVPGGKPRSGVAARCMCEMPC